jgi:hypothetical protein
MKDALITMVPNQSKPIILPRLYGKSKPLGNNLSMTAFLHIKQHKDPPTTMGRMGFVPTGLGQSTVDIFIKTKDWYNDHCCDNQALKFCEYMETLWAMFQNV